MTDGPVLDRRTLNRTLLARQLLLERVDRSALDVVEHLVGLQAQEPQDPYVGLWSRIARFDPAVASGLLEDRRLLRIGLMRTTLHLVTARDCLVLAPLTADLHAQVFRNTPFARALAGVDLAPIVAAAGQLLADTPMTPSELGHRLAATWRDRDVAALANVARYHLPLVQVPPRGLWQRRGRATNTTAPAWLGVDLDPAPLPGPIVTRYLGAFGPATVPDIRTWSGLKGLREVIDRLLPLLRTYRDEAGRELYDIEDGIVAAPDHPAPVRFLPQYDNVFLSHADRSRINGELSWSVDFGWKGPVLVDGFITAAWRVRREGRVATMTVEPGRRLSTAERTELEREAHRLLAFVADDADARELRMTKPN